MTNGHIVRLFEGREGTFGALAIDAIPFCVTLEPPDRENKRSISNIPGPQHYWCKRRMSRWGETFEVENVEDRTGILFHPGNFVENTEGCILLGEAWWKFMGRQKERGIKNTGNTFKRFMNHMGLRDVDEFLLTITYHLF